MAEGVRIQSSAAPRRESAIFRPLVITLSNLHPKECLVAWRIDNVEGTILPRHVDESQASLSTPRHEKNRQLSYHAVTATTLPSPPVVLTAPPMLSIPAAPDRPVRRQAVPAELVQALRARHVIAPVVLLDAPRASPARALLGRRLDPLPRRRLLGRAPPPGLGRGALVVLRARLARVPRPLVRGAGQEAAAAAAEHGAVGRVVDLPGPAAGREAPAEVRHLADGGAGRELVVSRVGAPVSRRSAVVAGCVGAYLSNTSGAASRRTSACCSGREHSEHVILFQPLLSKVDAIHPCMQSPQVLPTCLHWAVERLGNSSRGFASPHTTHVRVFTGGAFDPLLLFVSWRVVRLDRLHLSIATGGADETDTVSPSATNGVVGLACVYLLLLGRAVVLRADDALGVLLLRLRPWLSPLDGSRALSKALTNESARVTGYGPRVRGADGVITVSSP